MAGVQHTYDNILTQQKVYPRIMKFMLIVYEHCHYGDARNWAKVVEFQSSNHFKVPCMTNRLGRPRALKAPKCFGGQLT